MREGTAPAQTGGLGYMVQAAAWFAVMSLLVKFAGRTLPVMEVVFGRGCVTLLLSSIMLWRAGLSPIGVRTGLLVARGAFGGVGLICLFFAIDHLPLAEASVIFQTSPLFTALIAAWWLRERLEPRVVVAIALCLVGVALIAQPTWLFGTDGAVERDWRFVVVGLLAAVFGAFAYASVRLLGRTEHAVVIVFWFPVITVLVSGPFAIAQWVWPDATGWALLVSIGIVTQLAQLALTRGLARAPAGKAMTVNYLQIAFATLLGAVFLGEFPNLPSWAGIALIVLSLLGTAWRRAR